MLNILRTSLRTGRVTTGYPDTIEPADCRGRPVIDPHHCNIRQHAWPSPSCSCAEVCPSNAITISQCAPDGWRWQLDIAQCVFCGLCEEVCPNKAISMSNDFELASRTRDDLIVGVTYHAQPLTSSNGTAPGHTSPDLTLAGKRLVGRIQGIFKRSLHIRHMAAGSENSCDWEIAALLNPIYDVQRLGIDFVASPRHADLLLVTGAVTRHLEPALRHTYEAMPSPRLVVAVGDEACSGGVLQGSYMVAGGVDRFLPVDVYIPGDPPRPQAIIHGLLVAVDRLEPKIRRLELTAALP